jgi:hypothetical protein
VNPPRRHRGDRIQIHGDHGVTGDQEAVTRSVVRDVTRGVTGRRHAIPVGQERNARFRVESQQHVVESAGPAHRVRVRSGSSAMTGATNHRPAGGTRRRRRAARPRPGWLI